MDEPKQELKFCENCKKDVSANNFIIHSAHCQRNIGLCEMCKEPFPKNEIAAHVATAHSKVKCAKCGKEIEQQDEQQHAAQDCIKRLLRCCFCDIEVQASAQAEHEDYCGSRTERCDECGQYVMLKYRDIHLSSNHSFLTIEDFDKQHKNGASSASLNSGLKNFNTNKADKEPLSMKSHYSPGKRTNDMPQINVNANLGQPKETSKPILRDLYEAQPFSAMTAPSSISREQLDRLYAMQIAEDDSLSRPYGNSGLEDRISMPRGAFLPAEDFEHAETLQDMDLNGQYGFPTQWRTGLGIGEIVDREIGGIFPASQLIKPPEDDATLALPCEFCNQLYPAEQLLDHQRFCEFTVTLRNNPLRSQLDGDNSADRIFSPELNNSKNVENSRKETTSILNNFMKTTNVAPPGPVPVDKDLDRVIIPCEYCGTQFDSEYIIEHESGCGGFLEDEMPPPLQTPLPAPVIVSRDAHSTPTRTPATNINHGGERKLSADPQMDYLEELYLKEAIEKSLKDKNVSSEEPPTSRSPKVRKIPINVEPGYSPRRLSHRNDGLNDEEANALNRMRAAKGQFMNTATPLATARQYEQSTVGDRQLNSCASGETKPALNPRNTMGTTGARPKSFARRSDASPSSGDPSMERQDDARSNGRHYPTRQGGPSATPNSKLRDQTGPRGTLPTSTPSSNPRQVRSKQPQY